jgi:hypothetical protein
LKEGPLPYAIRPLGTTRPEREYGLRLLLAGLGTPLLLALLLLIADAAAGLVRIKASDL